MAIVGVGLDDQSLSTDDSYSHVYLDPQTPTVKGQYFQRGLLLRGPEAALQFLDPSEKALINVGGIQYAFPWSTLKEFPKSRLCQLRSCSTLKEIAEYCDDYDQLRHEYFFDRDPIAFRAIFTFLAKGRLHLIEEVCSVALHSELVYWGIDTQYMEPCCEHRMMYRVEQVAEHQRKEDEWCQRRREMLAVVTGGSFFHKLGEAVENPHSGPAGKVFAFLSVLMVVVTIVGLCISTMPDQRQEQAAVGIDQETKQ